ncbi:hypothetical protein N39L_51850 [Limnospira platensis NIES-39]|jgi:hypothetical protein|uniref:Uncharacterized protein n=3 Tax=Limnospira TaxID=2596745 RepID=A0A5M3TEB8_LIMPL|nr:hypothetical protein N39L_46750 [Arthrospira platensis NIES-39]BDT15462.1 hypothetical protein N39L_51850 [Arthrospira platensis NIES-39]GCE96957.1 hypothetical protein NIES46_50320 [Arthrospira platensis NIES-46]
MEYVSIQTHVLIGLDFSNPFFKLAFVIVTPTRLYSLQSNRDPSAYPYHYNKALAFGHISPPQRHSLTFVTSNYLDQIVRALEGLQRSVYMGIPSLDLSYPPGYF